MIRRAGVVLLAMLLLAGCAAPAPFYYCVQVQLNHPDGRQLEALECVPKRQKVPWDPSQPPGRDPF